MAGNIKSILANALLNIEETSLESFRRKLNEFEKPGFSKISLTNIEKKTAEELVDVICRHYTVDCAPDIIVKLLKEINERQSSLDLEKELRVGVTINTTKNSGSTLHLESTPLRDRTNHILPNRYGHHDRQGTAKRSLNMGRHIMPKGKPLPNIQLNQLTEYNFTHMKEDHHDKPYIYARLLFKLLVPLQICQNWAAQKVNFDGYGGHRAIPGNLLVTIMMEVRKEFGKLKPEDKKEIKKKLNYLLKNPPKTGWPRQF
ncbi:uncharacterized protein LOC120942993 [Rana temporaria]|uniref:uncharacterized protein LOC120942993 n=1 Tax=Rana temporaria TaxID=8407 RepID=UPI001AAD50EE|nr:uncharacterized protein LOC120942993 [Rana temporaria]